MRCASKGVRPTYYVILDKVVLFTSKLSVENTGGEKVITMTYFESLGNKSKQANTIQIATYVFKK